MKYTFITGASRGIGFQIAKFLASKGHNLVLQARTIEGLAKIKEEVSKYNIDVILKACDLENIDEVNQMLASIDVEVDRVINNAGIQRGYASDFLNSDYNTFVPQFKVNCMTPLFITYHFLKQMDGKEGYIINVTSGIDKEPQQPAYSASKAALDKVTKDLAHAYKDTNITISLADPGWCRTDLGGPNAWCSPESSIPGMVLGAFSKHANGKIVHAQDFADMTLEDALVKLENY